MRLILTFVLLCWSISSDAATVIYLHGKIVEDKGDNAVHPRYGTYEYGSIVSKLRESGHTVLSEVRPPDTDRVEYAAATAELIRSLIEKGTAPNDIVVIGFSKGAQIAILVSQQLADERLRFVFQAVCGSWLARYEDVRVHGTILSQYETSDAAGSCEGLFARSPAKTCEIPLATGLEHGAFYRPLDAWFEPLVTWIKANAAEC